MSRVDYFKSTLKRCKNALAQNPEIIPLEWIIEQLNYLINIEKGWVNDYSRLAKIKIGWIAAREMDGYEDKELIQDLCLISEEVDKMLLERGLNDKSKKFC